MNRREITVTVETDDDDTLTRAVDTLTRAMTGLALEGIPAYLSLTAPAEPQPDAETEEVEP